MGLLLALLGFVLIVAMGATVLGFIGGAGRLDRRQQVEYSRRPTRADVTHKYFEPLVLLGHELDWPSETDRIPPRFEPLAWPSDSWNDPHFGREHKVNPMEQARKLAREVKQHTDAPDEPVDVSTRMAQEAADLQRDVADDFFETMDRTQERFDDVTEDAHEHFEAETGVDPARLAQLVEQHGLAGAVERVRGETGWGFKEAAQAVAKAMRR